MSIEGKVAAILNERDLIINKGADAGITEDMKFKVVDPEVEIKDPDTGEALGSISMEKVRVRIVEVQSKFSIGKTYETYTINVGGVMPADLGDAFRRVLSPRQEVTRVRTLRIDPSAGGLMTETKSFVKVGDTVIELGDEV